MKPDYSLTHSQKEVVGCVTCVCDWFIYTLIYLCMYGM